MYSLVILFIRTICDILTDDEDDTDTLGVLDNNTPTHSGRSSPAFSDDGLLDGPVPPSRPAPPARPEMTPVVAEDKPKEVKKILDDSK